MGRLCDALWASPKSASQQHDLSLLRFARHRPRIMFLEDK